MADLPTAPDLQRSVPPDQVSCALRTLCLSTGYHQDCDDRPHHPRPLCPVADGSAARGQRADRALQLALCAAQRRQVHSAHRGYGPGTLRKPLRGAAHRGSALAGPRLGRRPVRDWQSRRAFRGRNRRLWPLSPIRAAGDLCRAHGATAGRGQGLPLLLYRGRTGSRAQAGCGREPHACLFGPLPGLAAGGDRKESGCRQALCRAAEDRRGAAALSRSGSRRGRVCRRDGQRPDSGPVGKSAPRRAFRSTTTW